MILALSLGLLAQTKVNLADLNPPKNLSNRAVLFTGSGLSFAALDGLVLDTTTSPNVLRVLAQAANKTQQEDWFHVVAGQTSFTLSANPSGVVEVYRNGVKMEPTVDFILSVNAVTFTVGQGIGTGDTVCLSYWK